MNPKVIMNTKIIMNPKIRTNPKIRMTPKIRMNSKSIMNQNGEVFGLEVLRKDLIYYAHDFYSMSMSLSMIIVLQNMSSNTDL